MVLVLLLPFLSLLCSWNGFNLNKMEPLLFQALSLAQLCDFFYVVASLSVFLHAAISAHLPSQRLIRYLSECFAHTMRVIFIASLFITRWCFFLRLFCSFHFWQWNRTRWNNDKWIFTPSTFDFPFSFTWWYSWRCTHPNHPPTQANEIPPIPAISNRIITHSTAGYGISSGFHYYMDAKIRYVRFE